MGLSSKQIPGDGFDQRKTSAIQKSRIEQLKCPRCDSANTKFCYYNNYNKSQPRHFCRACKRHWTNGGTLRNVPAGGGRKNKPIRKSSSSSKTRSNNYFTVQAENQRQTFPLISIGYQKNGLLRTPAYPPVHNLFNSGNLDGINYSTDQYGLYVGSNSSFLNSRSFDTKPFQISTSFRSSGIYSYLQDQMKTIIDQESTNSITHPMNLPINSSSNTTAMATFWNWEDMDSFVATDLNLRWDDFDLYDSRAEV